jgi:hypothetical protein
MWWSWLACHRECEPVAWADADGDGHGDPSRPSCDGGDGAPDALDCDDTDARVYPGAPESCDGRDQDCDGWPDDHPDPPRYLDADGDGFGADALPNCDAWGVEAGDDCDDADPLRSPDTRWYADADGDGAGGAEVARQCADPGGGAVRVAGDCDDDDASRSPLAREVCDGRDQDCADATESSVAWMAPEAVARVRVSARGSHDVPLAVVLEGSVGEVRAFVQECGALRELPAAVVPGDGDPWRAGDPDPAASLVVVLWDDDGDLGTVEPWPADEVALGLYLGAGPGAWTSDLLAGDDLLATAGWSVSVDPARGALVDGFADELGPLGGQAQASGGNGLRTTAGPLSVAAVPGASALADGGPVTASLTTSAEAADAAGRFTYAARWRVFAGRAAAVGRVVMTAVEATSIEGADDRAEPIRPLQLRAPAGASCAVDPALRWGDLSTADRGLTWVWAAPPRWTPFAGCGPAETWTSANDLPAGDVGQGRVGTVPAGQVVVDGGVVVVLGHGPGGAGGSADRRDAWAQGVVTAVGAREE